MIGEHSIVSADPGSPTRIGQTPTLSHASAAARSRAGGSVSETNPPCAVRSIAWAARKLPARHTSSTVRRCRPGPSVSAATVSSPASGGNAIGPGPTSRSTPSSPTIWRKRAVTSTAAGSPPSSRHCARISGFSPGSRSPQPNGFWFLSAERR